MSLLRRLFGKANAIEVSAIRELAASTVWGLDKARMILANAQNLHSVEEMKRSIGHAMDEIEPVFDAAKRVTAQLRGSSDADVE
jgi:hypothetical protein